MVPLLPPSCKAQWFAYPYDPPTTQQAGTVVDSPGITLRSACSTVDVLAAAPAAKPRGAPLMTELPPAELSAAMTLQGSISRASLASAGNYPILDSIDSSLSSEGLETSKKSKPLSEKEELAALREALAELYANIIEQAGDKHCETLTDIAAASVLEWGLCALEQVWLSEGS